MVNATVGSNVLYVEEVKTITAGTEEQLAGAPRSRSTPRRHSKDVNVKKPLLCEVIGCPYSTPNPKVRY